ncbi:MAG: prepilin-type N-terminal cleavage/methylation domain-containing protein [Candidatus Gracilibacteria bacterium]|nr:prepilin-type N-terminal cleavage/methylation domain-containing protein [Candidatus Gracilibacteria bacterium]
MSTTLSKNNYTRGFSLIEVLVALTLFGLLISGIITFVTAGIDVTQKTETKLVTHKNENAQTRRISSVSVFPVERIDGGASTTVTTSGAILQTDGDTLFIGTESMSGVCTNTPNQQYLVTYHAIGLSKDENKTVGNYQIANDGLSILSGATRIIGSGVRGGTIGQPLETEFGGMSSISGTGTILAMADSNNEQILFWNTTTKNLAAITTRATGIQHPMSVRFLNDSLLIGGRNGLFQMRDSTKNGSTIEKNATDGPAVPLLSLGRLVITLDGGTTPTNPTGTGDITLEQWQSGSWQSLTDPNDTLAISGTSYIYTFSGSTRNMNASNPIRMYMTNIAPTPSTTGQYSANLEFYNTSSVLLWSKRIPYFTRGDGDIQSLAGNTIELLSSAPHVRNITNETLFESGAVTIDNYLSNVGEKTISVLPIRDFRIQETSNAVIINYEAYTDYDCRTGVQKSKQKTLLFRKK